MPAERGVLHWQLVSELLFELQLSNPTRGQLVGPGATPGPVSVMIA
jgi:hypothetical protein